MIQEEETLVWMCSTLEATRLATGSAMSEMQTHTPPKSRPAAQPDVGFASQKSGRPGLGALGCSSAVLALFLLVATAVGCGTGSGGSGQSLTPNNKVPGNKPEASTTGPTSTKDASGSTSVSPTPNPNSGLTETKPTPTPGPNGTAAKVDLGEFAYLEGRFQLTGVSMKVNDQKVTSRLVDNGYTFVFKHAHDFIFTRTVVGTAQVAFPVDGLERDLTFGCPDGDMVFETSPEKGTGRILTDLEPDSVAGLQPCTATWQRGHLLPPAYEQNLVRVNATSLVKTDTGLELRTSTRLRTYGDLWMKFDYVFTFKRAAQ